MDGAIDEMRVFITALLAHLPGVELLDDVFVLGALGPSTHYVLFVRLLVYGCIVAVGLALIAVLLEPH